jgi:hypothetical protein
LCCQNKKINRCPQFQDFSAGLAKKIRTLTKITTLLGTFGQWLSISPKKDPHLASNGFDAIFCFFRKQNADIHLMGVHGFTKDDLYNLGR